MTESDLGHFYQMYRQLRAKRLNERALLELERHRKERPLCHGSQAHVGSCRCDCGGIYHGGRLPVYGTGDDRG